MILTSALQRAAAIFLSGERVTSDLRSRLPHRNGIAELTPEPERLATIRFLKAVQPFRNTVILLLDTKRSQINCFAGKNWTDELPERRQRLRA